MATKTSNTKTADQRKAQVKDNVKKFHDGVLKTSEDLLNGSVKAGAKWQELIATAIKKSEPVAEKNIDILFDTAEKVKVEVETGANSCLLYTSPSPRDQRGSRMPSSA